MDERETSNEPPLHINKSVNNFLFNTSIASYRTESSGHGSFALFPKLPVELRVRIWAHAISVPRIVEMEKIPSWHDEICRNIGQPDRWHYRVKSLPALLSTCSESRQEVLEASRGNANSSIGPTDSPDPAWIRYDYDILHLKARTWVDIYGTWIGHRWFEPDVRETSRYYDHENRNSKMRNCFNNIQAVAINQEVFLTTAERPSNVMRHFFPNLKLLIVLIDGGAEIHGIGRLRTKGLDTCGVDPYQRWAFMTASTGPFRVVCERHIYQRDIERTMRRNFRIEEERSKDSVPPYVAPQVVAMGCSLPPGVKIPACGQITSRGFAPEPKEYASFEASKPCQEARTVSE
ncbi:hypothetical protein BJ875DRAFT_457505 [Amylocarpus encephaloides]|uniref:2EXR domain-containing protein n=1 Tax=Amylocarpus encephaloides TaxID=45428 RepID=A0A9P7YLU1_9HELO|nr:hypothetical protein BJ875DRAFT_457505 [Amylocarpus encephaloides]